MTLAQAWNNKTILITGGAGFIGSSFALSAKASAPGARIIAVDNLKRRGSELNVRRLQTSGVEFQHCDIRVPEDLALIEPRIDVLIECSAEPAVLAAYTRSARYVVDTNLTGTVNCLERARQDRADVLFLSTSRVYPLATLNAVRVTETETRFELQDDQPMAGASSRGIAEEFPLQGARSLYGATKLASELLVEEYAAMYGMRYLINRCGVIAGPGQMGRSDQGVFTFWAAQHVFDQPLKYKGWGGTGKQVRDLLHVKDLWRLIELQVTQWDNIAGQTFNVGGGRQVSLSLREASALCRELTGNTLSISSDPETHASDVRAFITDNSKVTAHTGWQPQLGPREIMADIIQWLRAESSELASVLGHPSKSVVASS